MRRRLLTACLFALSFVLFAALKGPGELINVTGLTPSSTFTATFGSPSQISSFYISGTNVVEGGLTVTPPDGFEISTDGRNFSDNPINIYTIGTDLPSTSISIRLKAGIAIGSYSGLIQIVRFRATGGPGPKVSGTVTQAKLIITADDKSKTETAQNPTLTVSYSGFVNGDGPAQLITQPVLHTAATASSPTGKYPITVDSAAAPPIYQIVYVPGTLTITPQIHDPPLPPIVIVSHAFKIPNAFTPNGDGINDVWNIQGISNYPKCVVSVYNRYGQTVYLSTGYAMPFDGRFKGAMLPGGTYYYVIDTKSKSGSYSGALSIIR